MNLEEKQQQVHELSGIDLDVIKTWDYRKLDLFHFSLLEIPELPEVKEDATI